MLNDSKQKTLADVAKTSSDRLEKSDLRTKLSETLRATSRHYTYSNNRNAYKLVKKNSINKLRKSMGDSTKLEMTIDSYRVFNTQLHRRGEGIPLLEAIGKKLN